MGREGQGRPQNYCPGAGAADTTRYGHPTRSRVYLWNMSPDLLHLVECTRFVDNDASV